MGGSRKHNQREHPAHAPREEARGTIEMVRKYPEIKAISYINWDWVYWSDELGFGWHDWEDARIQNDEVVRKLYIEELSHPIWIHAPDAGRIIQPGSPH